MRVVQSFTIAHGDASFTRADGYMRGIQGRFPSLIILTFGIWKVETEPHGLSDDRRGKDPDSM